jgi:hypothetical protein
MNIRILSAIVATLPVLAYSQTAIDAFQLSHSDLRGTARYMSMGGAFGALGGDLSTLNNNPGGIGLYRKSELGVTLNIEASSIKSATSIMTQSTSQTKVSVPNFGYVGAAWLGNDVMPYFTWGVSYGRIVNMNRRYKGQARMNGSLYNYVAQYSDGYTSNQLSAEGTDNGGYSSPDYIPWLSILSYNGMAINPIGSTSQYQGPWQNDHVNSNGDRTPSTGISEFDVDEHGYVDEYAIDFGGNIMNTVYWGMGFGITDIELTQNTHYTEDIKNAVIMDPTAELGDLEIGNANTTLSNYKHIDGTGFNFKLGVIVRPINALRIGFAFHTPTYYNINQSSGADLNYDYTFFNPDGHNINYSGTPNEYRSWKLRTPWRMQVSAAGIIGTSGIISMEYEYRPYQNMNLRSDYGDELTNYNQDIKTYYKAANILRFGAEYRILPQLSIRAGYVHESTPTGIAISNNEVTVYTSNPDDTGTNPAYTLDNSTQYITCGLGYRYKNFSIDAAYVYKHRTSEYHSFTPNDAFDTAGLTATPYQAKLTENYNNIVLTATLRF